MTRRIALLAALFLWPKKSMGWDFDDFARAYTEWIQRERSTESGVVDAKAIILWQKVKAEWPKLKEFVDAYYKGR